MKSKNLKKEKYENKNNMENIDGYWWKTILGEYPDKAFRVADISNKCYNCGSTNLEKMEASPWTGKKKCTDCNYYNYYVYQDRMGGGLTDDVAISKNDIKI